MRKRREERQKLRSYQRQKLKQQLLVFVKVKKYPQILKRIEMKIFGYINIPKDWVTYTQSQSSKLSSKRSQIFITRQTIICC